MFSTSLSHSSERYHALSYTWGTSRQRKLVQINCESVKVTCNLEDALRHIRHALDPMLLWVDAVCINQGDPEERNSQVARIQEIYRMAGTVFAWIGPPSPSAALVYLWLDRICTDPKADDVLERMEDVQLQEFLPAWSDLINRPYWSRLWIVQELAAARSAVIVCGQNRIDWETFKAAHRSISSSAFRGSHRRRAGQAVDKRQPAAGQEDMINAITQIHRNYPWPDSSVLVLLEETKQFCATEARDRIYAPFGLLQSSLRKDRFSIRYEHTLAQAFVQLASHVYRFTYSLDFLSYVAPRSETKPKAGDKAMPSWTPNWQHAPENRPLILVNSSEDGDGKKKTVYSASQNLMGYCRFEWTTLTVRGFVISTIIQLSDVCSTTDIAWQEQWASIVGVDTKQLWATTEDIEYSARLNVFWRTILGDVNVMKGNGRTIRLDDPTATQNRSWSMPPDGKMQKDALVLDIFIEGQSQNYSGRRLFVGNGTAPGGLAPPHAQVGDQVCCLFGGDVLYILRTRNNRTKFIGECYVHGLMDGQAIDALQRGEYHEQDFVLY